jgi:hypothetical protein
VDRGTILESLCINGTKLRFRPEFEDGMAAREKLYLFSNDLPPINPENNTRKAEVRIFLGFFSA